jgi:hypothetical protein
VAALFSEDFGRDSVIVSNRLDLSFEVRLALLNNEDFLTVAKKLGYEPRGKRIKDAELEQAEAGRVFIPDDVEKLPMRKPGADDAL